MNNSAGARLESLDVFRGATVAAMILVNNPGSWSHIYGPLRHADWHGWTPTDFIFPFFLYIVGVAITLSQRDGAPRAELYSKIARRTLILFGLGLFLNGFPFFELSTLRIMGVLQRIALCYFCAAILHRETGWRGQAFCAGALLLGYWAAMALIPVPELGAGSLDKGKNLAAYFDSLFLDGHMWSVTKTWDPEGLLSTVPAVATTLMGVLTGHWLAAPAGPGRKVSGLLGAGIAGLCLGAAWGCLFPINKNLWTSSYAIFMGGWAALFLAALYWAMELRGWRFGTAPFVAFGRNAIAVYVLSGVLAKTLTVIKPWEVAGKAIAVKQIIYENAFASWLGPINGSLGYALAFLTLLYGLMWLLHRRKIYLKI
ncbi:MAG: DUF1624 domain-containing protein [Elusimicrobia bacterium]|nr:DUF1624 domain-containing protein [Elusimicrobiota bacterium]